MTATLLLAKSLGHGHTPDLTGGSLPVTGMHLILQHNLPSGAAAKPVMGKAPGVGIISINSTPNYLSILDR